MDQVRSAPRDHDADAIRVAIADDEQTVQDVLRALIGSDPRLRFVGAAHDAEEAIDLVIRERPDVVLVDVRMPGGGGPRAVREITKRCPDAKVVALSAFEDADTIIRMIGAGAKAFVPKADSTEKILREIHRAADPGWTRSGGPPRLRLVAPDVARRDERGSRVARAILDGAVTSEFEPITDAVSGELVGVQCHPRVATLPHRSFDAWTADAQEVGLLEDLELAAMRAALQARAQLPAEAFLELEVSPATAASGGFRRIAKRPLAARLVAGFGAPWTNGELASVDSAWREAVAVLRARGLRVCAKDVGSDVHALRHLTWLCPSFVRLDPAITSALGRSFPSHAVVAATVAFAQRAGARVIAPEVASDRQLAKLVGLGVDLVQGPIVGPRLHLSELREGVAIKDRGGGADDG